MDGDCFCSDAPPLDTRQCGFDQLTPYQVNAGRAFTVSGSQTGLPFTATSDQNGQCVPIPTHNPPVATRIPMDADPTKLCSFMKAAGGPLDPSTLDTRTCNAASKTCPVDDLMQILKTAPSPDPCLFISGPNETDPTSANPHHVSALFRNIDLAFVMTNLDRGPTGTSDLRFDVHGGFRAQAVVDPATVEVSMPARIVVGPILVGPNTTTMDMPNPSLVPYLFVVDQRRLGRSQGGGPTRGQLLRIHPLGLADTNGAHEAWFEDLSHSNNEFPMQ